MKQLQDVFGYKKTKTTPYRPQGNSVSERMHSTQHAMLSMYSNIAQNNWAEVLPFIQLAHNTYFSSTMHETPFFLMFGRQARLPIDIIFGIPHVGRSTTTEEFAHSTRGNMQIAFELARRNLSGCILVPVSLVKTVWDKSGGRTCRRPVLPPPLR